MIGLYYQHSSPIYNGVAWFSNIFFLANFELNHWSIPLIFGFFIVRIIDDDNSLISQGIDVNHIFGI